MLSLFLFIDCELIVLVVIACFACLLFFACLLDFLQFLRGSERFFFMEGVI